MNRLLLLPGFYRYNPMPRPREIDTSREARVPIYIVSEENGYSLIVMRQDAPDLFLYPTGGGQQIQARAGAYFPVPSSDCEVDLEAVAVGAMP